MLGGVGNIGTISARRRVIAVAGGGGGAGVSRSGSSDSNHVHTISGLNTLFLIPNIVYSPSSANDNDENYSIKDILFTSGSNASHTFYLATKGAPNTTAGNVFQNDLCIGAIQIHTASEVVFAGGAEDTSIFTTIANHTFISDPTNASLTYSSLSTSSTGQTSWVGPISSTGSNNTGATDSIATTFQNTNNPLPNAGDKVIPQASSTNYIYSEASGLAEDDFIYLKFTVSLATNTAHKFIFAYNLGVKTDDTGDDKDDNVAIYIDN